LRKPRHIGIIMDGNGRWAQLRGRPRTFGHIKGTRTAKKVITACRQKGIEYLTLYAFSTENWLRPIEEVSFLMNLLRRYIKRETNNLIKQNIRFVTIGDINRLPPDLVQALAATVKATENNTGMVLTFALSYGSRWEIVRAAKLLADKVKSGELSSDQINEKAFESQLLSHPIPDLDLIIRTSGETRLSNFMLWQAAYAELIFTETLWPDFDLHELDEILLKFIRIERRFGAIKPHENTVN
jgi:undecaprenyl diphosphate synthase